MFRVAINGFGRIGRAAFRAVYTNRLELGERLRCSIRIYPNARHSELGSESDGRILNRVQDDDGIEVVAVNDLADGESLANLLKYDSVYGVADADIAATAENTDHVKSPSGDHVAGEYAENTEGGLRYLKVGDKAIRLLSERDPSKLPWRDLGVDVVLECTGVFSDFEKARAHLDAGAKKVIISANAKGDGPTVVLGTESVRQLDSLAVGQSVFSMASCTTNCIAPVMQVLKDNFGVEKSLMTTTHAYTATQNLVDGSNKDLRRARAAAVNAVPTTTGAAKAAIKVVPALEGKFDGIAVRIPVSCGSLSDMVVLLSRDVTADDVNRVFKEAAKSDEHRGIIEYSEAPLVSSDIIGNPHSAVVDGPFTRVVGGNLVKVLAWYDNEWAYSCRLIELAQLIGKGVS